MYGAKYRNILKKKPVGVCIDLRLGWRLIFQQENDPKRHCKIYFYNASIVKVNFTMEWIKNKLIQVLKWPSQSSHLNPIENLWTELKTSVHKCSPSNLSELQLFYWENGQKFQSFLFFCQFFYLLKEF